MLDPYRMIVINIFASFILFFLFLIYKYIKPKKTPPYILMIFLVSLLPLISLLRKGSYESGDLSLHAMRIISYHKILFTEHIRPVWTPEFNAGYGDPHFLFSYFLPYFLGSIIHQLGFSLIFSIKILLAITYILSGMFMYVWVKYELNKKSGLTAAIIYLFAPYHLIDMHFRVSMAESMAFAFFPLCLYLVSKLVKTLSLKILISLSISYSLLILTHQITSLGFAPILISYALIIYLLKKKKSTKEIVYVFLSFLLALGLSSFYWLPIIAESKFTQASLSQTVTIFPLLQDLLLSPWRHGFLFQGHYGELSFIIGYTQLFVLLLSLSLLFISNRKIRVLSVYFLICSITTIFLILPYSGFVWENVPLLKYFQYSYRLLAFLLLFISFLAGCLITRFKSNLFFLALILITIFYTGLNWGNRNSIPKVNDEYLKQEFIRKPDVGSYLEPSSPIWANINSMFLRKNNGKHIEVMNGKANITEELRSSTKHTYKIETKTNIRIKENTLYFPGWNIYVDNIEQKIQYNNKGVIEFNLKQGSHNLTLKFEDTFSRKIGKYLTYTSVTIVLCLFLIQNKLSYKKK